MVRKARYRESLAIIQFLEMIYIIYICIHISFLFTSFTLFSIIVFHAPTTQLKAAKNLKLSIKT